ncbi:hypothetical protein [Clostridium sp. CF012]|uniref:hypothetical protein n=1 Tax=Clostridium sp. CF012 TaxID=2843319 RepID=UPI001C0DF82F|nr:hypothetical protein [Clostridium sp. CF012]MBU3143351.1 hypothetical protein [Clostridium sp. CF012]
MLNAKMINGEIKFIKEEVGGLATYEDILNRACEVGDVPEGFIRVVEGVVIATEEGEIDLVRFNN